MTMPAVSIPQASLGSGAVVPGRPARRLWLILLAVIGPALIPLIVIELWAIEPKGVRELPGYTASLDCTPGRCEPPPPRLDSDSILDLTLRPRSRISGAVALRAALVSDSGVEPWPVTLRQSPEGTFHLRAPVRSLPQLQPGRHKLLFVIGRPLALADLKLAQAGEDPSVILLRQPLEIH